MEDSTRWSASLTCRSPPLRHPKPMASRPSASARDRDSRSRVGRVPHWLRARDRAFTLAIRNAFAAFGAKSVIQMPVRLLGERRVHVGREVFIGAGSWIQVIGEASTPLGEPSIVIGDRTSSPASACFQPRARSAWGGRC